MNFVGLAKPLSITGLDRTASNLGVDLATLFALIDVETAGCGFLPDRRVVCRFESHVFYRLSGKLINPLASGAYAKLESAMQLDEEEALRSTSWGLGQIMGFNAHKAGFKNTGARGMISAFADSEDAQLEAIGRFCRNAGLADELQRKDWTTFAYGYNGPAYHENSYDIKLAAAYEKFSSPARKPDIRVRSEQVKMMFAGLYKGKIDGIDGPKTQLARNELLASGKLLA